MFIPSPLYWHTKTRSICHIVKTVAHYTRDITIRQKFLNHLSAAQRQACCFKLSEKSADPSIFHRLSLEIIWEHVW